MCLVGVCRELTLAVHGGFCQAIVLTDVGPHRLISFDRMLLSLLDSTLFLLRRERVIICYLLFVTHHPIVKQLVWVDMQIYSVYAVNRYAEYP